MPKLSQLCVRHVRNLESVDIDTHPKLNIITGANGAGKSSLLESINLLAHGRSFRTHKYRSVINQQEEGLLVRGVVLDTNGEAQNIGLQRKRSGETLIRLNGNTVPGASVLARTTPLLVVNSDTFSLLDGTPKDRRKFFDWLVFHVKHDFQQAWSQLIKCYKHRNTLLRRDKIAYSELEPWDREIARLSGLIDGYRHDVVASLREELSALLSDLPEAYVVLANDSIQLHFKNGWRQSGEEADLSYFDQLHRSFAKDKAYGYSTLGPQKADMVLKHEKSLAVDVLSRGQQKLLVSALVVAQAKTLQRQLGHAPIFAVDDLPAELDPLSQSVMGTWLAKLDSQVFVTGVDDQFVQVVWPDLEESECAMFHVKHGQIHEYTQSTQ